VIAIAELIALKTMRSFKSSLVCCLKNGHRVGGQGPIVTVSKLSVPRGTPSLSSRSVARRDYRNGTIATGLSRIAKVPSSPKPK
jgi:hypothetical protein